MSKPSTFARVPWPPRPASWRSARASPPRPSPMALRPMAHRATGTPTTTAASATPTTAASSAPCSAPASARRSARRCRGQRPPHRRLGAGRRARRPRRRGRRAATPRPAGRGYDRLSAARRPRRPSPTTTATRRRQRCTNMGATTTPRASSATAMTRATTPTPMTAGDRYPRRRGSRRRRRRLHPGREPDLHARRPQPDALRPGLPGRPRPLSGRRLDTRAPPRLEPPASPRAAFSAPTAGIRGCRRRPRSGCRPSPEPPSPPRRRKASTAARASARAASSLTRPPLPTRSGPTSNCGFTRATRSAPGAARARAAGSALARPMKLTSLTISCGALGDQRRRQVAGVRGLQVDHPRIGRQLGVQLAAADVDGVDPAAPARQADLGEAAGRGADVQHHPALDRARARVSRAWTSFSAPRPTQGWAGDRHESTASSSSSSDGLRHRPAVGASRRPPRWRRGPWRGSRRGRARPAGGRRVSWPRRQALAGSSSNSFFSSFFRILPLALRGRVSGQNTHLHRHLEGRQPLGDEGAQLVLGGRARRASGCTTAAGSSPSVRCGMPTRAASITAGWS